jgi:CheY-like chemotaxis protein
MGRSVPGAPRKRSDGKAPARTWSKDDLEEFTELAGVHVMVVDDNGDAREILRSVLNYCGALVTTVDSAAAALKLLHEVRPDVVVSDIAMPRNNGLWLIREIRSRRADRGGQVPVLAISAHDDVYDRTRLLGAGFQDYLVKPVSIRDLARVIARLAARAAVP